MAERSTVEILKAARDRITPEEAWTTGTYSRNADHLDVLSHSKWACCWCAIGSLACEMGVDGVEADRPDNPAWDFLWRAARDLFGVGSPATVNDENGHDAVLAMYDRAIELAEAS